MVSIPAAAYGFPTGRRSRDNSSLPWRQWRLSLLDAGRYPFSCGETTRTKGAMKNMLVSRAIGASRRARNVVSSKLIPYHAQNQGGVVNPEGGDQAVHCQSTLKQCPGVGEPFLLWLQLERQVLEERLQAICCRGLTEMKYAHNIYVSLSRLFLLASHLRSQLKRPFWGEPTSSSSSDSLSDNISRA